VNWACAIFGTEHARNDRREGSSKQGGPGIVAGAIVGSALAASAYPYGYYGPQPYYGYGPYGYYGW